MNRIKNFVRANVFLSLVFLVTVAMLAGVTSVFVGKLQTEQGPVSPPMCRGICRDHHFREWSWKPVTRDRYFPVGECVCSGRD